GKPRCGWRRTATRASLPPAQGEHLSVQSTGSKRGSTRWDSKKPSHSSRQNLLHHVAAHISQPMMPSLELERQAGVVDAQAVQDRRVQVVDVDRIAGDVVAVGVGFAVGDAGLDGVAGRPGGGGARMVGGAVVL